MGLLDGLMGALGGGDGPGGQALAGIAGQLGIDPATAQNLVGTLAGNLQGGQSLQDAIGAAAEEHGIDPAVVGQLHDAVSGGEGGGLGGLLGGLFGGSGSSA